MHQIDRSALVPHSAEHMFELVNNVRSYKTFLPWCSDSDILTETDNAMTASVTISYKGINKTFITQNSFIEKEEILLELVDGPFSELKGVWQFKSLDTGSSRITLNLSFSFSNILLEKLIAPIFKPIANSMIDSFITRADQIYGNNN